MTEVAPQEWTLQRVLDAEAIDVLFQPVVELATGRIVGYEAVSRGPVGSAFESADALLAAARAAGVVTELDWTCRALAIRAIRAADADPRLTWFLNVEPAGLTAPCPPHLLPDLQWAQHRLKVVFEIVERELESHVAALIYGAELARESGWAIALDDVGARRASVALLPLLEPDIVKLDGPLIRSEPTAESAAITAAVRRYAEVHGACILAEGIETEEHEQVALTYGAVLGQGWRYGRPAPLVLPTADQVAEIPRGIEPTPTSSVSPFETVSAGHSTGVAPKRLILHISRHLEAECARLTESAIVLVCFEHLRHLTAEKIALYDRLAEQNTLTVVAAAGLPARVTDREQSRFTLIGVAPTSPMAGEWAVIILNTEHSAAFVGRDCGDSGADLERRFEFVYTYDRTRVVAAARAFLRQQLH
ncbi:EAL domain-containing protein [Jatrophihabitans sp.]|uniref:sensor domain-containing phosphodiesterase n=1 Tax=Jatrophihabitans sp. TaxID=1932789 RepID=UPI0030C6DD5A|nr:Phytochrome-like protein cph2 [Jatrophihabitans sp.]